MIGVLRSIFTTAFAASIIRISVPILFAALAACVTERAGATNIGIEGTMSLSALCAIIFSHLTGSMLLGTLAAVLVGVMLSMLVGFFALKLKTDIILCGIAVNMLGGGGAVMLLYLATGAKSDTASLGAFSLPKLSIPLLKDIPVIGDIFFSGHSILVYIAFLCVWLVYLLFYKTPLGLKIRAVGENPNAADSVGVNVKKIQYIALSICGALAGLAGAYMSMSYMTMFSKGMISGRGFIALAAKAMGRGEPVGTMLASLLFGFAQALANYVKGTSLPAQLVDAIPYAVTILGLSIYAASTVNQIKRAKKRLAAQHNETVKEEIAK